MPRHQPLTHTSRRGAKRTSRRPEGVTSARGRESQRAFGGETSRGGGGSRARLGASALHWGAGRRSGRGDLLARGRNLRGGARGVAAALRGRERGAAAPRWDGRAESASASGDNPRVAHRGVGLETTVGVPRETLGDEVDKQLVVRLENLSECLGAGTTTTALRVDDGARRTCRV